MEDTAPDAGKQTLIVLTLAAWVNAATVWLMDQKPLSPIATGFGNAMISVSSSSRTVTEAPSSSISNKPMLTKSTKRSNLKNKQPPLPLSLGSFSAFAGLWIINRLCCGSQFGNIVFGPPPTPTPGPLGLHA
jgi:hypothetical protein